MFSSRFAILLFVALSNGYFPLSTSLPSPQPFSIVRHLRGGSQGGGFSSSLHNANEGKPVVTRDVRQDEMQEDEDEELEAGAGPSSVSSIASVPALGALGGASISVGGVSKLLAETAKHATPTAALQTGFASVVKVFAWTTEPHFSQPWQMRRQRQGTGSGFIISGHRILTNAHNVANQNWVLVQRHGIPKKYPARVLFVGHECDLAIIGVEDGDFWVGTKALEFGDVPELQQSVIVVGFPTGGDNLCVTAGVVSRVDVHEYAHSGFNLLCVQIDAAVIGVAFQGREDAENVGYIIPCSVVNHFLTDIERNQRYTGFVTLGITWAPLENKHLRDFVGIDNCELPRELDRSGIMVCKVDQTRHSPDTLQTGDTLLAIDGVSIADDGTIKFRMMERLAFAHLISQKFVDDVCEITLLRGRKVCKKNVVLKSPKYFVPECVYDVAPRYYIVGCMVFVPLTLNYMLHEFGKRYYEKAPNVLLAAIDERFQSVEGEEVVVLSQILAAEICSGYDGIRNIKLDTFNGKKVLNLKHLYELVESCTDEFLVFGLSHTQTVVLRRKEAIAATKEVLKQHNIAAQRSPDL
ncbi:hypothetical protein GUITHDRAFT_164606 [Guillardia theta CCMP2712]|uniref:Protease Do-like PDZ domain-containing protein n=1 Tax=Guillardia theta (strain CCMP2712) TaxID=905079 RepID=L1IY31_GUITC|nr:hypothetical protein GUITHDRAFT_164606 [Guillardia theta CCMP2712]EKX40735.1 hypothetical protein GUITHDRAFT_164606 [Guillardia theta CCMP2712]|eukprot:XP_005827715.1 hypothetical protein GUITHDRAFT_164606 [Guillardia theta CCMP2712]